MNKQYLPCLLPEKLGKFEQKILNSIIKKIYIEKDSLDLIRSISKEGPIIFATKYPSHFDFLVYNSFFYRVGVPYPRIFFDMNVIPYLPVGDILRIGRYYLNHFLKNRRFSSVYTEFYETIIKEKIPGIFSILKSGEALLRYLLELQKRVDFPIYIIPTFIFYKNSPEKVYSGIWKMIFSSKDKVGLFTKLAIFLRQKRKVFIDIEDPINLRNCKEDPYHLKQRLLEIIERQKRAVLGPVIRPREEVKERVLSNLKVDQTIKAMAKGNEEKIKELRKQTESYFEEIAADYNMGWALLFSLFLTWFWKRSFHGIDVPENVFSLIRKSIKKGHPVVYVPSHKSHVDYLIINYLLFKNHIHPPRIAAGKNLSFWPVGYIFKKCGAFFIRRSFKGAKLYTLVFESYIKHLLQEGYPIEFFIEGGRSRSGKLEFPKTGFLSILLNAWKEGYCKDITFIPASITYDTVVEEDSLVNEMKGKEKEPESFKQIIKSVDILKKKFGKIYIRFSDAISLKEYIEASKSEDNQLINLAFDLVRQINRTIPVTPVPFISIPIMSKLKNGFYFYELRKSCEIFLDFFNYYNIPLASLLKEDMDSALKNAISILIEKDILIERRENSENVFFYCLNRKKGLDLSYYRNHIIHYLVPCSLLAISIISLGDHPNLKDIRERYFWLRNLFKYEFIYETDPDKEFLEALNYFLEKSYLKQKGHEIQKRKDISIWANILRSYIEAYWLTTKIFLEEQKKEKRIREKELLKKIKEEGDLLYKRKIIKQPDSISYPILRNSIRYIKENPQYPLLHKLYTLLQSID